MKNVKKMLATSLMSVALLSTFSSEAEACTRVFMNQYPDHLVAGRNLDFFGPVDPYLVITPRGVGHNGGSEENAAQWKTKYGSVVIYADSIFPMDGLNEKGLSGHTLFYTDGSQVQQNNLDKPVIETQAWLSYILDNFATVDEAVKALKEDVRMVAVKLPIDYASDTKHIALEDATGDAAIIEIDNGKVNIYHDKSYTVMTNPPSYSDQLKNLDKYKDITFEELPGGLHADVRFIRAAAGLKNLPKPDNKFQAQGFVQSVLANVAYPIGYPAGKSEQAVVDAYSEYSKHPDLNKGVGTYWTTISDITAGEYHFKSVFAPSEVWVSLKEINFSEGNPVQEIKHLNDYALRGWEGNILSQAKTL